MNPYRPKKTKHAKIQKDLNKGVPKFFTVVEDYMLKGEKIEAIKCVARHTDCSLMTAKKVVENVITERKFYWEDAIKRYL
tara:strand:+ start:402 stop:641 length:240 start_codon:yes stop_codon:yes gene_type:complete